MLSSIILLVWFTGCALVPAGSEAASLGIAPSHAGYVPARIAILPCAAWPNAAHFESLPLTNAAASETTQLCAAVDAAVLAAFNGQPYMRGYAPKVVEKQLEKAGKSQLLADMAGLFGRAVDTCQSCRDVPNFYLKTIKPRPAWQLWATSVGKAAKNSDAMLLPFLTYAYAKRFDDRGLAVAERAAGVVLLLVDTATGDLIWSGAREAVAPNQRLGSARPNDPANALQPPPWTDLTARLLTEDLWRDFPGRQIY